MALKWDWFLKSFRVKDNDTGGTPAGSNGQVQFNDNDSFGADSNFFWDNTLKELQTVVIRGSDQSGGNLVLKSTSNATKGKIFFGANSVYDELNESFGIGTASPVGLFQILKEGANTSFVATNYSNSSGSRNAFSFQRYGGTLASPSSVGNSFNIFQINSNAYDGTALRTVANMSVAVESFIGTDNISGFISFYTRPNGVSAALAERVKIDKDGKFFGYEVYNTTVGGTNRDLYVDDTGLIGYVSSALKYKENIRDISALEVENIFKLPVKKFDYKDTEKGINQIGIIAEDMEQYFPELCSYKYEYVEETQQDAEGNNILVRTPVLDEQGNHIRELETVQYSKVGLLALLAVKNLDERLKVLENV